MPLPPGPANFPIVDKNAVSPAQYLAAILKELKLQNAPSKGLIRGAVVTTAAPKTLEWQAEGIMQRLVLRNKGPDSVFYAYDVKGESVDATEGSNASFEVQAQESVNLVLTQFSFIGLKVGSPGKTAKVNAQAWKSQSGTQAGSV